LGARRQDSARPAEPVGYRAGRPGRPGRRGPARLAGWFAAGALALGLAGLVIGHLVAPGGPDSGDATAGQAPTATGGQTAAATGPAGQNQPDPDPDPAEGGNLAGNIGNGGFAVAGDQAIYLASKGGVYELGFDGTVRRELFRAGDPHSLNYWEGALYYSSYDDGIVRHDLATGRSRTLTDEPVGSLFVEGGRLYFELASDDLSLYAMAPDGGAAELIHAGSVLYGVVYGGRLFFADRADDFLYATDLATGQTTLIRASPSAWPSPYGGRLYFSDFSSPSGLTVAELDGSGARRLADGAAAMAVASAEGLIYSNGRSELVQMSLDGGAETVLTANETLAHCVAGGWIFYRNGDEEDAAIWMIRPDGSEDHRFEPPAATP
jgi:hypothetical protein